MSDGRQKARHSLTRQAEAMQATVEPSFAEFGIVSAVSGNLVAVRRTRDTTAASQLIARIAGPSIIVGDSVVLFPVRGGGLVASKVGGFESLPLVNTLLSFDGPNGIIYYGAAGTTTVSMRTGAGSPEGVVTAPVGSFYLRTDGGIATSVYVKETGAGNTGWSLALTNKHIYAGGANPTWTVLAAGAGTTGTGSVSGNDMCGVITVTPGGTGIGVGSSFITLSFATNMADTNYEVFFSAVSSTAAALTTMPRASTRTTGGFNVSNPSALVAGTAYQWAYLVVGHI